MIVSCGSCQSRFRIDPAKVPPGGTRIRCPKCKGVIAVGDLSPSVAPPADASASAPHGGTARPAGPTPPRGSGQPGAGAAPSREARTAGGDAAALVIVAHGNPSFCDTLATFLRRNRFTCETAEEGERVLAILGERRVDTLLLDVALPGIMGHTLCERIKSDPTTAGTRVVLIGAIYDRTRYRRPPASLYGADGYIEKHEIPDKLVPMLNRLLAAADAPAPDPAAAVAPARADGAPVAPQRRRAAAPGAASPGSEQARRLARIIVSDIVLYNPDVVKKGISEGNLADLLEAELEEGRDLLKARIGADAGAADYVLEALNDYVRRMSARNQAAAQR